MRFKDYYEILGVPRDASAEQIQKAFRDLARRHHPDVSKAKDAAERFKEINEAYEVLKDEEKRRRYDALGANWQQGQEFTPPPGFGEGMRFEFGNGSGGPADFSDFFASLFGRAGFDGGGFEGFGGARSRGARRARGSDVEAELRLGLAELWAGGGTTVNLRDAEGRVREISVRIPAGTTQGTKIRLAGQGAPGLGDAPAGDLFLVVHVDPDPRFVLEGCDLRLQLDVAPWEAALGATIDVATFGGSVALRVPPGASSGQTLRLRGLGVPRSGSERGDLLVKLRIVVPRELSDEERSLFEQLRDRSPFRPRGG
ncbi:MAG: DnaJ domain-containing protein [Planctomycetes bacterium]|nr:DnaJ domain-containing protein [Planctomycetota bacterium]